MNEEIQHLSAAEEHAENSSEHLAGAELPHQELSNQELSNQDPSKEMGQSTGTPDAEIPATDTHPNTDNAVAEALFGPEENSGLPASSAETETSEPAAPVHAAETASDQHEPSPTLEAAAPAPEAAVPAPEPSRANLTRANLAVTALSDVGCVRTNNEDAYGYDPELGIFVICDGMGGMAAGEVASATAAATLVNTFSESSGTELPVSTRLQQAVHTANRIVWELGQLPEHKGMGTTTVTAALDGFKLVIANVGDSRAYLVQNGHETQITVDHSYINELIRNGTLTPENAHLADLHGYESVITRAIGVADTVEPDYYAIDLTPGTQIVLATDGLTRYLQQGELAAILQATPFESVCANLIDLAKRRGGHDNITCVLLQVLPPQAA
jgi:serine/threonine protein phosphatase PrpC